MLIYQAIETKYHPATNLRGSRHSAKAEAGRVLVSCPPELNPRECHAYAAQKLAEKLKWAGKWYGGVTKAGYVFVLVRDDIDNAQVMAFEVKE